ncbi:MAG: hypothetical protein N4A40_13710 [Tissierellales bacterium]|jgi:hypothetical protein|nr:hypothetical protein [Tissierellales bacterium]
MDKSTYFIAAGLGILLFTLVKGKKITYQNNNNLNNKKLSLSEVAEELGITIQAVEYYISKGLFNTITEGDNVFILRSELNRVLAVNPSLM